MTSAATRQAVRWLMLSGLSFTLNVGLTIGLHELARWPEEAAFAAALVTVTATNFLICRYFVFESDAGPLSRQLARFLAGTLAFRGLEYVAFLALHTGLGLPYYAVIVPILMTSLVAKFFVYRLLVFAPQTS